MACLESSPECALHTTILLRRIRYRQLSSDPEVVAVIHGRTVRVFYSVVTPEGSSNFHVVSNEALHDDEDGVRTFVAGALSALEAGGGVRGHNYVLRSPERCRERVRGVDVDKLHRSLGARRRMMGSWRPVSLCHRTH